MSNQYEVLGKAPVAEDLKKLSSHDIHLKIKTLNAGDGNLQLLPNFDLYFIIRFWKVQTKNEKNIRRIFSPPKGAIFLFDKKIRPI